MTQEAIAALPQAEQELYLSTPMWATIAFGCAVWGGAIGCLLLLLKNAAALYLLVLSACGVAVKMFHAFVISDSFEVFGPGGAITPVMIAVVAVALVWLSVKSKNDGWLR